MNLSGKQIALTRTFSTVCRARLADLLRRRGAEVVDRVTHRTAYLIVGGGQDKVTRKMTAWRAARGGAFGPGYIPEARIVGRIIGPEEVEIARLPAKRKAKPLEWRGNRIIRRQGGGGEIRVQGGEIFYGKLQTRLQASRSNKINRWLYENSGHSPALAPVWMSNWRTNG